MNNRSIIIRYTDAEDASCPDDPINAGIFTKLVRDQNTFIELLKKGGGEVITVDFDKDDYEAYRKATGKPDTRATRAVWAGLKLPE